MRHITNINKKHKEELAKLFKVSEDYVSKVIRGARHNKAITDAYNLFVSEERKSVKAIKMKVSKKLKQVA
jgi:hypothetical protein